MVEVKYKGKFESVREGLHAGFKVTQVTLASGIASKLPPTAMKLRKSLSIYNNSGSTIFIGGADISDPLCRRPLPTSQEWGCDASDRNPIYGFSSATVSGVYITEIG